MAKRRRRRRSSSGAGYLVMFVLILGLVALVISFVASHLLVSVVVSVTVAGGAGVLAYGWRRHQGRRRRLRSRTLGQLLTQTPTGFEGSVADLLHDLGYRHVQRIGGPGDLAADIMCHDPNGRSVVVQCKRYALGHLVGSPEVQTFIGMLSVHHQADRGIYVTTSGFSRPAQDLARQHRITLVDGDALSRLVLEAHDAGHPPPFGDDHPISLG